MIVVPELRPVLLSADLACRVIEACREVIAEHEAYLCDLDCAIGDGDHGTNMRRGLEALAQEKQKLAAMPFSEAMIATGTILVMNVGGAAGPLYGTLLLELGKGLSANSAQVEFAKAFEAAVAAVARRGKSEPGEKTLLDVLCPLSEAMANHTPVRHLAEKAHRFADMTIAMRALRGRASFLGDRSVGHKDPGAASCALLCEAICGALARDGAA